VGQTSRSLIIRYKEHIRYVRSNNPQSEYALHILENRHEYGPMDNTMILLKHINNQSLLLPYEQYHNQVLHHNRKLIPEQSPGDTNPLFEEVKNPHTLTVHNEQVSSGSAYTRIPHHQQTIPLHNISTPQVRYV